MLFSGIVDPATLNLMANMGLANMKITFYNQAGTYTYTPSPNLLFAEVECIGGGLNTGQGNPPNSAQAGGYARSMISAFEIGTSQQVTVGANQQQYINGPIQGLPSTFGPSTFSTFALITSSDFFRVAFGLGSSGTSAEGVSVGSSAFFFFLSAPRKSATVTFFIRISGVSLSFFEVDFLAVPASTTT